MPTKTSKSPYTIAPAVLAPIIKAGIGGTANVISNYRQAKAAGEDYSLKQGAGDAIVGMAGSFGMGGLMDSQDVTNPTPQTNFQTDPMQQPPTTVDPMPTGEMVQVENIDPAQSQLGSLFGSPSPQNMKENRTKKIGAYQMSYAPTKMSAYQAKQADKMMNISGAFTLTDPQKEKIASKSGNPNEIESSDFAVLREEKEDKAPMTMNYQKAAPMMDGQSIYTYYKK